VIGLVGSWLGVGNKRGEQAAEVIQRDPNLKVWSNHRPRKTVLGGKREFPTLASLGIGATCEFGVSDREVTTLISTADKALQSSLERRINEGKDAGEISAEIDARSAAQFIKATFAGIKVAARGGAPAETLRNIARMAVRSLK